MKLEGVVAYYKQLSQKVSNQTLYKPTTDHGKNNRLTAVKPQTYQILKITQQQPSQYHAF